MRFGLEQDGGSLIIAIALPHPLHPINSRLRNKRRDLWVGQSISSWWPLSLSRNSLLIYSYLYVWNFFYKSCGYRTYISIQRESVVQYWWSCTPSQSIGPFFLGMRCSCVEYHLLFSLVSPTVSCSMKINLKLRCLWPLVFVLNNIFTLGILRSAISHLPPRMFFCPLDHLLVCRIQHGTIKPPYFTSRCSTRIFYRGVSGFATDCPCGVLCRGLTTCSLYAPLIENRLSNNSYAVNLIFCILTLCNCICLNISYDYLALSLHFTNSVLYFFKYSCTNSFYRCSLYTFHWDQTSTNMWIKHLEAHSSNPAGHVVQSVPLRLF